MLLVTWIWHNSYTGIFFASTILRVKQASEYVERFVTMELLLAAIAAVAAAVTAAKAIEKQNKAEEEKRVKIPIRVEETRPERRDR